MAGIQILAAAVAAGQLPGVCARHGEQGERTPVRLVSRPPDWAYPLAIIGVVIFVIVVYLTRKVVVAPGWPLCRRCRAGSGAGAAGEPGDPAGGGGRVLRWGLAAGEGSSAGWLPFALGLIALLAGLVGISRATPQALARVEVCPGTDCSYWSRSPTTPSVNALQAPGRRRLLASRDARRGAQASPRMRFTW